MIHQQDPVGLITFDEKIRHSLPPRSKRTQLGNVLSLLANLRPAGQTDIAKSLIQIAAMLRHRSLVMLFTDLLADPEPVHPRPAPAAARRARRDPVSRSGRGRGAVSRSTAWSSSKSPRRTRSCRSTPAASGADYLAEVQAFCDTYRRECFQSGIDYVPLDTSMQFDRALTEYLASRRAR